MDCYSYALKYIHRTPKTEQDLRIKLFQKGYSSEDVQHTLEDFKKRNFINDELYTEMYLNSEIARKGKPLILISQKLQNKGIDKQLINKMAHKMGNEITTGIKNRIKKEIENYKKRDIEGFDIIQKLMRKGYKLDDIKRVITSK